jgi:predicted DNA-binding antitoxin AbrB/MazE fold protein
MTSMITVVYENGVLRPLAPLPLRERQRLQIQIMPTPTTDEAEQLMNALLEARLITPPPGKSDIAPPSDEERRELANRLGQAISKPISEIIIEDRGEW